MLQVILFILSVTLATVNGWGACESGSYTQTRSGSGLGLPYLENGTYCNMNCGSGVDCRTSPFCTETSFRDGNYYYANCGNCYARVGYCTSVGYNDWVARVCTARCNTQCEADSIACTASGMAWNSDSCKCVQCDQADTTFTDVSCAFDAAKGKYLNIANKVTIVNCEATVQENQ